MSTSKTVVDVLELLPPGTLIERLGGEGAAAVFPGAGLGAPDKPGLKNALDAEIRRRGTYQGAKWQP